MLIPYQVQMFFPRMTYLYCSLYLPTKENTSVLQFAYLKEKIFLNIQVIRIVIQSTLLTIHALFLYPLNPCLLPKRQKKMRKN